MKFDQTVNEWLKINGSKLSVRTRWVFDQIAKARCEWPLLSHKAGERPIWGDMIETPPKTLQEIALIPDEEWLRYPNFGKASLAELRSVLPHPTTPSPHHNRAKTRAERYIAAWESLAPSGKNS